MLWIFQHLAQCLVENWCSISVWFKEEIFGSNSVTLQNSLILILYSSQHPELLNQIMFYQRLLATEKKRGAWDAFHRAVLIVDREAFIAEQRCLLLPQHLPHSVVSAPAILLTWEGSRVKYFSWLEVNPSSHRVLQRTSVEKRVQAGTSLAVQWLGLGASIAWGTGSIPG